MAMRVNDPTIPALQRFSENRFPIATRISVATNTAIAKITGSKKQFRNPLSGPK